jgi:hypothetical protein
VALVGCVDSAFEELETGDGESAIIGGAAITTDPEIVFLNVGGGSCTATVIAPQLALTAAHCVIGTQGGSIAIGNGFGDFDRMITVARSLPHRLYNDGVVTKFDIALLRLSLDAEVEPMAVNLDRLDDNDVGSQVRVVGFGVSDGEAQSGAGTKREVTLTIDELTSEHIGLGDGTRNICQGDSGGPTILIDGGVEKVVAVASFGSNFCMDRSFVTRTDVHAEFLREVIAAWGEGPCALDGECGTGCEFPDPDCDECGLDGVCAAGCPRVDLDCPVTGFAGDFCTDNDDCESRSCIEALDDPRIKYCSEACDADKPCTTPLACTEGMCQYSGTTPSAQGAPCSRSEDCRSGLCDATNLICVEPCSGDADCADPFACESLSGMQVCTVPKEGCAGCGTAPDGRQALGSLALLFVALIGYGAALRRRRRRLYRTRRGMS